MPSKRRHADSQGRTKRPVKKKKKSAKVAKTRAAKTRSKAIQREHSTRESGKAKSAIEAAILEHARLHARHGHQAFTERISPEHRNILGVGLTKAHPEHGVLDEHAAEPGAHALTVYLSEPRPIEVVRQSLREIVGSDVDVDSIPIHTVVIGVVRAQSPHVFRMRPAAGGVSSGSVRTHGGSLGCLVTGNGQPRDAGPFILSNNHVLANLNAGRTHDPICQPCVDDGGTAPADQIGALEDFVPIRFDAVNTVDAAIARVVDPSVVTPEIVFVRGGARQLLRVSSTPVTVVAGQTVAKSGRTTQLTVGQVIDASATIRIAFGPRIAVFNDQIVVRGSPGPFSVEGDSGSLVFSFDEQRNPVGLLFAAGGGVSFVNKIGTVLDALGVRILN